ncbi:MAG: hypothetical protein EOO23_05480 [Comamonadaceae bacterium]|nr:MAG: hypothetical protein EOO23_05480 [Comamonadaceae bacterium]
MSTVVLPRSTDLFEAANAPQCDRVASPLRRLALTVEESGNGEFHWSILETSPRQPAFVLATSEACFAAYDTALATGYGELLRLVGPELQYGPRGESPGSYQPSRMPEVAARLEGGTLESPRYAGGAAA